MNLTSSRTVPGATAALCLAAAITLTGCAAPPTVTEPAVALSATSVPAVESPTGAPSSSSTNAPGIVTFEAAGDTFNNFALTSGVLVFEDGCLRLKDGTIPIFPDTQSQWDGTTLHFQGNDYSLGDDIVLGGGEALNTPEYRAAAGIPDTCGDGTPWGVGILFED